MEGNGDSISPDEDIQEGQEERGELSTRPPPRSTWDGSQTGVAETYTCNTNPSSSLYHDMKDNADVNTLAHESSYCYYDGEEDSTWYGNLRQYNIERDSDDGQKDTLQEKDCGSCVSPIFDSSRRYASPNTSRPSSVILSSSDERNDTKDVNGNENSVKTISSPLNFNLTDVCVETTEVIADKEARNGSDLGNDFRPLSKEGNLVKIASNLCLPELDSEDVIIHQLFNECDKENKGKLRVSDITDYLRGILYDQLLSEERRNSLANILDPNNLNEEIDKDACLKGLHQWIQELKGESTQLILCEDEMESSTQGFLPQDNSNVTDECGEIYSNTYDNRKRLPMPMLGNQATDFHETNFKLLKELAEAKALIDIKDDELGSLTQELTQTKTKVKSLQDMSNHRARAMADVEDLTNQVTTLQDQNDSLTKKSHQAEQEKSLLQSQLARFRNQVTRLNSELSTSQRHNERCSHLLLESKQQTSQLKDLCSNLEDQLSQKEEAISDFKLCVKELSQRNEDLKDQCHELQSQLMETQRRSYNLEAQAPVSSDESIPNTVDESVEETQDEVLSPLEESRDSPTSIHNELKQLLNENLELPWPINEKEIQESVDEKINVTSSRVKIDYCGDNGSILSPSSQYDATLTLSSRQLRCLFSIIKKLKDENCELRQMASKTPAETSQVKLRGVYLEKGQDARKFAFRVHQEAQVSQEDNNNMALPIITQDELRVLKRKNEKLAAEVKRLYKCNVELAEKCHLAELKICDLEEESHDTELILLQEKKRVAELEDNLYASTLARQLDLQDIWRIVQKDVELEYPDSQDGDALDQGNLEHLKNKIKEDITSLTSQVQKVSRIGDGLQDDSIKGTHVSKDTDLQSAHTVDALWPSNVSCNKSHLIDALSIDILDENLRQYHARTMYSCAGCVSCHGLDCSQCRSVYHNLPRNVHEEHFPVEVPALIPTNPYPGAFRSRINSDSRARVLRNVRGGNICSECSGRSFTRGFNTHLSGVSSCSIKPTPYSELPCCLQHRVQNANQTSVSPNEEAFLEHSHSSGSCQIMKCGGYQNEMSVSFRKPRHVIHDGLNGHQPAFQDGAIFHQINENCPTVDFKPIHSQPVTTCQHCYDNIAQPRFCSSMNENATTSDIQDCFLTPHPSRLQSRTVNGDFSGQADEPTVNPSFHESPLTSGNEETPISSTGSVCRTNVADEKGAPKVITFQLEQGWSSAAKHKRPTSFSSQSVPHFPLPAPKSDFKRAPKQPISTFSSFSSISSSMSSSSSSPALVSTSSSSSSFENSWIARSTTFPVGREQRELLVTVPASLADWDLSPVTTSEKNVFFPEADKQSDSPTQSLEEDTAESEDTLKDINSDASQQDQDFIDVGPDDMKQQPSKPVDRKTSSGEGSKSRPDATHGNSTERVRKSGHRPPMKPPNPASFSGNSRIPGSPVAAEDGTISPSPTSNSVNNTTPISALKGSEGRPPILSSRTLSSSSLSNASSMSSSSSLPYKEEQEKVDNGVRQEKVNDASGSPVSPSGENDNDTPPGAKSIVPLSPPTARNVRSPTLDEHQPLAPSRLSRIRQSHLASRRREQMKTRNLKLPELAESSELESDSVNSSFNTSLDATTSSHPVVMPGLSSLDNKDGLDDNDNDSAMAVTTSSPSSNPPSWLQDNAVTPSLSDSILKAMGLSRKPSESDSGDSSSVDQLSEKEIESKFISLSLAFKTDKLTLDQRVSIQERSRDLAEQNVDKEIQGLREAIETLNQIVQDEDAREAIQKINRHIEVLEQSAARVSSRAEVYGAVQQEHRMSKAMEVMVLYTENLRRVREKEESELQEARKVLSERSIFGNDFDGNHSRRSMSVCGVNPLGRPMRRRSEVVLPKVLGGIGGPSMIQTASMENVSPLLSEHLGHSASLLSSLDSDDKEDARSRFQSAIASTSMQNAVTSTMRRVSQEKSKSQSSSFSLSPPPSASILSHSSPPLLSEAVKEEPEISKSSDSLAESPSESNSSVRKISNDESAYRKGFEEGFKAKLSKELTDLRDQQNSISQNIEDVMDKVDQAHLNDEEQLSRPSRMKVVLNLVIQLVVFLINYNYRENKKLIRNIAGVFFIFVAILAVFLSPPISTVDVQHYVKPPQ